jgi:hypothetical protein
LVLLANEDCNAARWFDIIRACLCINGVKKVIIAVRAKGKRNVHSRPVIMTISLGRHKSKQENLK